MAAAAAVQRRAGREVNWRRRSTGGETLDGDGSVTARVGRRLETGPTFAENVGSAQEVSSLYVVSWPVDRHNQSS